MAARKIDTKILSALLVLSIHILPDAQAYVQLNATSPFSVSPIASGWDMALEKTDADVSAFYKARQNQPIWFTPDGTHNAAYNVAIDVLKNVDKDGLNPIDYKIADEKEPWITQELQLTRTFLTYILDVRMGRLAPQSTANLVKVSSEKPKHIEMLLAAVSKPGNYKALQAMAPTELPDYLALRTLLATYKKMAASTTLPKLTSAQPLKPGARHPDILSVRQILTQFGDFHQPAENETSEVYDNALLSAVKTFQARHTLEPDGVIGGRTKDVLNWSLEERINKIIANMERLRWLPENLGKRYIHANISGYEVSAVEEGKVVIRMPAIVGKVATKTPLFFAQMKEVIVNPSWSVPPGIMSRDKLPKLQNDPGYARRAGFTVYDASGSPVDPESVDWSSEGHSYHLRQSPGAHNALGRIKLNIENPYTIYMHGTPEQQLFNKTSRGFSSGCIRLQDPVTMASWTLKGTKWGESDIQSMIQSGTTKTLPLPEKIPVYLTYLTVWVKEDGAVYFSDDHYKMDPGLIKNLKLS